MSEARQTIEKLDEVIKKVTSPANRIGTYLGSPNKETARLSSAVRIITVMLILGSVSRN